MKAPKEKKKDVMKEHSKFFSALKKTHAKKDAPTFSKFKKTRNSSYKQV